MSRRLAACFAAGAMLLTCERCYGQYQAQGGKMTPDSVGLNALAGWSVALSADGNTMLVGAPNDANGAGEAFVYVCNGGVWTQQARLFGADSVGRAYQGSAVALSADGNTALVGGSTDNGVTGAIWVYSRSNGVWTQQGPRMWGTVLSGGANQGTSVALSADGNMALEGGPTFNDPQGAAWVFTKKSDGTWDNYFPAMLVGSNATAAHQGTSVALSGDGKTAVVGGPDDNGGAGAVWIFTLANGVWSQQTKLTGTGGFGSAVALSSDGSIAAVGAGKDNNKAGSVSFFTRTGGQWAPLAKLSGTAGSLMGLSVALSGDGNTAAAGGPGGTPSVFVPPSSLGATWVFTRTNGTWVQGPQLIGSNVTGGGALQGFAVALSSDGGTVAVGGPGDNSDTGAAWVFVRPASISPPVITAQPASQTIASGSTAVLSVVASGPGTLAYQWYQGAKGVTTAPVGINSVSYTTPPLFATASYWVRVTNPYGSTDSNAALITVPSSSPLITSVANAAGHSPNIAPNTWIELHGANLAPAGDSRTWQTADFANNLMPTQLDGVSVTVNGTRAYISYISPGQINFLTPPAALTQSVSIQVTNAMGTSAPFVVQSQTISPAFFTMGSTTYIAAEHTNGSYLGPTSLYPGVTTPAKPGETAVLFGSGFGTAGMTIAPGSPAQSGTLASVPAIQIGGVTATVLFAGLVAPGVYQFNVVVPQSVPDGDNAVTALYNGLTTQAGVLLTVQH